MRGMKIRFWLLVSSLCLACAGGARLEHRSDEPTVGRAPVSPQVVGVRITTGDRANAGTDANVCIQALLKGNRDDWIFRLAPPAKGLGPFDLSKDPFEKGDRDEFPYHPGSIDQIERIRIWHDNTRHKPGWYLGRLELVVEDRRTKSSYPVSFQADRWLADDEKPDRAICVELHRTNYPKPCAPDRAKTVASVCKFARLSS